MDAKNPRKRCPMCGKQALKDYLPFCSKRCANEDLSNWIGGKYAVPVTESEPDESAPAEDTDPQLH